MRGGAFSVLAILAIAGCAANPPSGVEPVLAPLPPASGAGAVAAPRLNGLVGTPTAIPGALTSTAAFEALRQPTANAGPSLGVVTLDFADTDIREVATQILGSILHVNFIIDPAVHGTATLHTATAMSRSQIVATLQSLLAVNNATIIETAGMFRVVPVVGAAGSLGGSDANSTAVPLRYASAAELAKVLQPFLQNGGRIAANPGTNGLIVVGDPATREALVGLIRTFDVDSLAGQSYALFPVTSGDAQDTAQALQVAFRTQASGTLANVVRVVPMQTINSVLLIASNPGYIEDARRVYALIDRVRRLTVRSWHAYYLQNSRSNDVTYVLQQAFTPGHVTAVPSPAGPSAGPYSGNRQGGGSGSGLGGGRGGGGGGLGSSGGLGSGGGLGSAGGLGSNTVTQQSPATTAQTGGDSGDQASLAAGNPLLGGLGGAPDQSDNAAAANTMRIIQNSANNAVLVYGTPQESETVEAMLRKIDIVPLQVLIDAVIAEVTLTDDLKYGTQFFLRSRGVAVNGNGGDPTITSLVGASGLFVGGTAANGAPALLSALQAITRSTSCHRRSLWSPTTTRPGCRSARWCRI